MPQLYQSLASCCISSRFPGEIKISHVVGNSPSSPRGVCAYLFVAWSGPSPQAMSSPESVALPLSEPDRRHPPTDRIVTRSRRKRRKGAVRAGRRRSVSAAPDHRFSPDESAPTKTKESPHSEGSTTVRLVGTRTVLRADCGRYVDSSMLAACLLGSASLLSMSSN